MINITCSAGFTVSASFEFLDHQTRILSVFLGDVFIEGDVAEIVHSVASGCDGRLETKDVVAHAREEAGCN